MSHFDETDIDSFYFSSLTFEEATKVLLPESTGTFLLRDSSSTQGFVLVVRESVDVKQYPVKIRDGRYFLREESSFSDLPALLSFYKRNLFETTSLIQPISRDKVKPQHRKSTSFQPTTHHDRKPCRASAPPTLVRVTKMKSPSPYDTKALPLNVGDVIQVTKRCDSGHWEGELTNGKKGVFPFTHVEVIDDQ